MVTLCLHVIWNLSTSNDIDKIWIEADRYGSSTTRQILDVSHLNFFEQNIKHPKGHYM